MGIAYTTGHWNLTSAPDLFLIDNEVGWLRVARLIEVELNRRAQSIHWHGKEYLPSHESERDRENRYLYEIFQFWHGRIKFSHNDDGRLMQHCRGVGGKCHTHSQPTWGGRLPVESAYFPMNDRYKSGFDTLCWECHRVEDQYARRQKQQSRKQQRLRRMQERYRAPYELACT